LLAELRVKGPPPQTLLQFGRAIKIPTAEAASVRPFGTVERNEPCPCGSGQQFKRCHGVGRR